MFGKLFCLDANALLSAIIGREYCYLTFKGLSEEKKTMYLMFFILGYRCDGLGCILI